MKKERLGKGILSLAMAAVLGAASFLPAAAAYPAGRTSEGSGTDQHGSRDAGTLSSSGERGGYYRKPQ